MIRTYDDWKLSTSPEYDELGTPDVEEPACDCGQPLEGGEGSLCSDCAQEAHSDVIKACACGARYTREEWLGLPYVGKFFVPADENGPENNLELRNCKCGSTIAIDKGAKRA